MLVSLTKIIIVSLSLSLISCKPKKESSNESASLATKKEDDSNPARFPGITESKKVSSPSPVLLSESSEDDEEEKLNEKEKELKTPVSTNLRTLDSTEEEKDNILDHLENVVMSFKRVLFIDENKKLVLKEVDLNKIYRSTSDDQIVLVVDENNTIYTFDTKLLEDFEKEIQPDTTVEEIPGMLEAFVLDHLGDREFRLAIKFDIQTSDDSSDISYVAFTLSYDENIGLLIGSKKIQGEFYSDNDAKNEVVSLSVKGKQDDKFNIRKTENSDSADAKAALALLDEHQEEIFKAHYHWLTLNHKADILEKIDSKISSSHPALYLEFHPPT